MKDCILSERVLEAIEVGEKESSKFLYIEQFRDVNIITGFTSNKIRHFLNHLCKGDDTVYFEVGCYYGATLQAASYKNTGLFYGIDNFSEFDGNEEQIMKNFANQPDCKIHFFKDDCFSPTFLVSFGGMLLIQGTKINVFFYDGNHTFDSQKRMLKDYYRLVSDEFIYIIDDWNWQPVREGTITGIKDMKYEILFEKQIFTSGNQSPDWWNGLAIFVLRRGI